jgi:hypothetical protein
MARKLLLFALATALIGALCGCPAPEKPDAPKGATYYTGPMDKSGAKSKAGQ